MREYSEEPLEAHSTFGDTMSAQGSLGLNVTYRLASYQNESVVKRNCELLCHLKDARNGINTGSKYAHDIVRYRLKFPIRDWHRVSHEGADHDRLWKLAKDMTLTWLDGIEPDNDESVSALA